MLTPSIGTRPLKRATADCKSYHEKNWPLQHQQVSAPASIRSRTFKPHILQDRPGSVTPLALPGPEFCQLSTPKSSPPTRLDGLMRLRDRDRAPHFPENPSSLHCLNLMESSCWTQGQSQRHWRPNLRAPLESTSRKRSMSGAPVGRAGRMSARCVSACRGSVEHCLPRHHDDPRPKHQLPVASYFRADRL